jgi:hypothetical protein
MEINLGFSLQAAGNAIFQQRAFYLAKLFSATHTELVAGALTFGLLRNHEI